jgi:hypothetical protein
MAWYEDLKNLEAEILRAKVFLRAKCHWEGDPTHGVGSLVKDDAKEGLVACRQPLEVEVHLLQGVDEDNVEPTSPVDEGLREQGALDYGLDDKRVGPRI